MKLPKSGLPLRTALIYLLFGGLWILLSDRILFLLVPDPVQNALLQTFKGWLFVLVGGALLYVLLRGELRIRIHAEQALRASQEQLLSFIEQAPLSIAMFDREMRYLAASRRWVLEYGRGHTELIGRSHYEIHPDLSDEWKSAHRRGLAGETLRNDDDLWIQGDGRKNWLRWALVPWRDPKGEIGGIIISAEDITAPKLADERLHLSDEILQRVNTLVLVADSQGEISYIGPAVRAILGYEPEELLGDNWWKISRSESAEAQPEKEYVGRAARREIPIAAEAYERPIRDRQGNVHWISWVDAAGPGNTLIGVGHDITERKRAEEQIASLSRFPTENPNPVLRLAPDGEILYANSAAAPLLNFWRRQVNQKVPNEWQAYVMEVLGSGLNKEIEFQIAGRTLACILTPIQEAGYVNVYGGDVTQRKQAEEALRESEALYRRAIETADAVPYREFYPNVNEEHIEYQFIGEGIRRITGYGPEEFNASLWESITLEMHPRDDLAEYSTEEAIQRVRSGKNPFWRCDFKIRARDGTIRWVFESALELRDEQGISHGSIGMFQDITERKLAEQVLHEREQQLSSIYNTAADVLFLLSVEEGRRYRFVSVNESFLATTGLNEDQVIGKRVDEVIPEPALTLNLGRYGQAIEEKRIMKWEETSDYPKGRLTGEVSIAPVFDGTGACTHLVGAVHDITDRKQAEEKSKRQVQRLSALHEIDLAISGSVDMRVALDVFLRHIVSQLKVDAAAVLLFHPHLQTLEYTAGLGFRSPAIRQANLKLSEGYAGRAVRDRRIVHTPDLMKSGGQLAQSLLLADDEFVDYYGIPLMAKGQVMGVLEIYHRAPLAPDPDWLEFLDMLAGQGAIAIDNSQLFDSLQRSNTELTLAYDATIEGWSAALDLRDKETEGHTRRVTELTLKLARAFDLGAETSLQARRGALLHDIGKMGVPDGILLKPGPLTDAEWVEMKKHPTFAYDLLSPIHFLRPALDIPYCHHEKWDGSGYPRGLKGEQIPLVARIFAVVDVWDALTNDRPYRPAWTKAKSLKHIKEGSGKHFDTQVVDAFLRLIAEK